MGRLSNFHQDRKEEKVFLMTLLSNLKAKMQSCSGVIEKIQNIAKTRFCLQMCANFLKDCYTDQSELNRNTYSDIFEMTAYLCDISCHTR